MVDLLAGADVSIAMKAIVMVALIIAGGSAIWSALWPEAGFTPRGQAIVVRVTVPAPMIPASHCPPLPKRLGPGHEMHLLTAVFERARSQFQSVQTNTVLARRQIDVAEMGLLRLLQEVDVVMPSIRQVVGATLSGAVGHARVPMPYQHQPLARAA